MNGRNGRYKILLVSLASLLVFCFVCFVVASGLGERMLVVGLSIHVIPFLRCQKLPLKQTATDIFLFCLFVSCAAVAAFLMESGEFWGLKSALISNYSN